MKTACRMINLALKADVSPLKLNQGAWFFAAHVAVDEHRLNTLLSARMVEALREELELMRGFLPSDTPSRYREVDQPQSSKIEGNHLRVESFR
jgi:hypothetical protein